ncbi:MAG: undecaprenyldiphospho-muramoylpentapeptide beta-N-acetylglucosaminyltransferase [Chlorobi bacterium]|nr:undecaprenyldiphospho-muramoylpentapeptide beta-N-acetylglucosaminyltransferase [Chlorobiota bacterium]
MNKTKPKILLSGGGTGGHIFPAVAIADALKHKYPDAEILFVGAKGRMEMERVPQAGYNIKGLWISGFQRKLDKRNLAFPFKLISSLLGARKIIKCFKPEVAIGTGGYASGPTLYMASRKGVPTLILEQNSYPGITNRLLSKTVDTVCVAYPGMEKYFDKNKLVVTGSPIRVQISRSNITKKEARDFFHLDHKKPTMLVIGGSQGALGINRAVSAIIKQLCELGLQILWQTGIDSFGESEKLVNDNKLSDCVFVHKFIMRMEMAYAAGDFVVSRAGAIALAEIVQLEKPAIFIPLPTAAEDHQTKNAMSLVDGGAALILNEKEAPNKLLPLVNHFMLDEDKKSELIRNIRDFKTPDATKAIVDQVVKLLKR